MDRLDLSGLEISTVQTKQRGEKGQRDCLCPSSTGPLQEASVVEALGPGPHKTNLEKRAAAGLLQYSAKPPPPCTFVKTKTRGVVADGNTLCRRASRRNRQWQPPVDLYLWSVHIDNSSRASGSAQHSWGRRGSAAEGERRKNQCLGEKLRPAVIKTNHRRVVT